MLILLEKNAWPSLKEKVMVKEAIQETNTFVRCNGHEPSVLLQLGKAKVSLCLCVSIATHQYMLSGEAHGLHHVHHPQECHLQFNSSLGSTENCRAMIDNVAG
jgi:hypothetical protein